MQITAAGERGKTGNRRQGTDKERESSPAARDLRTVGRHGQPPNGANDEKSTPNSTDIAASAAMTHVQIESNISTASKRQ
jgi:hypothetical protein